MNERDKLIIKVANVIISLQELNFDFSFNILKILVDMDRDKLQQFYKDVKSIPLNDVYEKYNLTKPL